MHSFVGHAAQGLGTRFGFGELRTEQGRTARTVIAATVGGLVSEHTGGKFANGAITAAFTHLFNAEAYADQRDGQAIEQARQSEISTLLNGAQDGHLTKAEADAWYQHMNGADLTVDASQLTIFKFGFRHVVYGVNDYLVHGQVSVRDGQVGSELYNFEQHDGGFFDDGYLGARNGATAFAAELVGAGTPYTIHFAGQPRILDPIGRYSGR